MKKTQEREMTFPETLIWLLTDLQYARASFVIGCDLPRAHPAVIATAPFFFQLTANRHADAVNLHASKLYDSSRRLSIPGLAHEDHTTPKSPEFMTFASFRSSNCRSLGAVLALASNASTAILRT